MKKTRHLRRGKKQHRTRKHRGGGGCFGGICSSNKIVSQVEEPGKKPEEQFNFNNPLHLQQLQRQINAAAKKAQENKAKANANLKKTFNELNKIQKASAKPLKFKGEPTNEEIEEEMRKMGLGEGTGLEAGNEVNADLADLEEWFKNLNNLGQEGGGGCFGGICSSNRAIAGVEEPGSVPTEVANPMQTEQEQQQYLRSLIARKAAIEADIARYTQEATALKNTDKEAAIRKLKLRKVAEQRLHNTEIAIQNGKIIIIAIRKAKAASAAKASASGKTRRRRARRT